MDTYYSQLKSKIKQRTARTAVVGLGYVGLPLAFAHAKAGFNVTGIEQNPDRVADVNRGKSYIEAVTDDELASLVEEERLLASSDFTSIYDSDVIAICVPTPLTKNKTPDTSSIEYVAEQVQAYLRPGQLFVLESTTYPGTTEEILLPYLTASQRSAGCYAHPPRRVRRQPARKHSG